VKLCELRDDPTMTIKLFSWGYWGWGNTTRQLVEAADIAERGRGFQPPIFVDTRLRRQGRAKGFVGDAFRDVVGQGRYCWMKDLGNFAIAKREPGVEIKNPAAVADLLQLARSAAEEDRRVIFYCACAFPWRDGGLACHRHEIANLLLAQANKIGLPIQIVEWPGGEPSEASIGIDGKLFSAVMRGRMSVPFGYERIADFAGLPWGSVLTLRSEPDSRIGFALVGPARFAMTKAGKGYWYFPILEPADPEASKDSLLENARRFRAEHGLNERQSE
jgi:hypothetical protein